MSKHIVICCDGTWQTATENSVSNIVKITRAIAPQSAAGTNQITYYDPGVGTNGEVDKISGGAFGDGLDNRVLEAYFFIINNYRPGDKLYLFGFSRGAYTVRSLVGLINNAGLLNKQHAKKLNATYILYRSKAAEDAPQGKHAKQFRTEFSREINIHFLGVFDTVGALGVPLLLWKRHNRKHYGFHDTSLTRSIKNAFHALAIDEKRRSFIPTIWQAKPETYSEQVWFSGVHSDVGGGYQDDSGLADICLTWMLSKAQACGLDINYDNIIYHPNPMATLHNSYTIGFKPLGYRYRNVRDHRITCQQSHKPKQSWWLRLGAKPLINDAPNDMVISQEALLRMHQNAQYQPKSINPELRQALLTTNS